MRRAGLPSFAGDAGSGARVADSCSGFAAFREGTAFVADGAGAACGRTSVAGAAVSTAPRSSLAGAADRGAGATSFFAVAGSATEERDSDPPDAVRAGMSVTTAVSAAGATRSSCVTC